MGSRVVSTPNGPYRSSPASDLGAELARSERRSSLPLLFTATHAVALGLAQGLARGQPVLYGIAAMAVASAATMLGERAVRSVRRRKLGAPPSVTLHERGLTAPRGDGSTSVVLYADVEHLFVHTRVPTGSHIVLDTRGGERVVIESGYGRFGALTSLLQERISVPRIAEARRVIASGGAVELFVVRLTETAISIRGAELPWSELELVRLVDPEDIELRAHGRMWRQLRIGDVDHVAVLGALLRDRTRVVGTHPFGILV